MASDLISRDAAIEALWDEKAYNDSFAYRLALVTLIDVPAVDAEPVRHGEWEACGIGLTCKICHKGLVLEQGDVEMNYCPNCGAKMDGGKQDD